MERDYCESSVAQREADLIFATLIEERQGRDPTSEEYVRLSEAIIVFKRLRARYLKAMNSRSRFRLLSKMIEVAKAAFPLIG